MRTLPLFIAAAVLLRAGVADAVSADPTNYTTVVPTLKPGDTLSLASGTYTSGLNITNLNGSEGAWITIEGPASGPPATFEGDACCNTVEITDSSYVAIKRITVDGKGIDGVFGVSAKSGLANVVHHITIEGNTFVGQGASQQTVAISTKTPTWGWTIRGNVIEAAGTGLYLGNSNYEDPFIGGVIEGNLVRNTIGYTMQIKNQNAWPDHPGLLKEDARTIIRHNVFIKDDTPSPDGDRPNLFVGAPPVSGPGSGSLVEIYGNLFVHNVPEALLQAAGRVTIHDNIFVDAGDIAINIRDHDGFALRLAHVYNNTIYSAKRGVLFGSPAAEGDAVLGNLIFAESPIEGPIKSLGDNLGDTVASAPMYVTSPSTSVGQMDFYPLAGKTVGGALDLAPFAGDAAYLCDFNGSSKGDLTFRGAYAGAGQNPGWKLAAETKSEVLPCNGQGGGGQGGSGPSGSGSVTASSGAGGGGGAGPDRDTDDGSTCGCQLPGESTTDSRSPLKWGYLTVLLAITRRIRRVRE